MAHLEGAKLSQAHLEGADLVGARLDRASLNQAHLEGASLSQANFEDANLSQANLDGATLSQASLERANLGRATLREANLSSAHLEGANLTGSKLEGANLRKAWLDSRTMLRNASLDRRTRLGDIQWGGVGAVNLTQLDWDAVSALGDEHGVGLSSPASDHQAVVRAYRQLASQLRSQGLTEVADRFAYRANLRQRGLYLRRFYLPQYLGSLLLDLISGYGYRPARSLITYILVILAFAGAYLLNAQFAAPHLTWDEALVLSISSFHGRGFFTTGISLSDTLARLAAGEAVIGLLIEITFIATFTQRFFAR
jgi:hypothetical protein